MNIYDMHSMIGCITRYGQASSGGTIQQVNDVDVGVTVSGHETEMAVIAASLQ